MDKKKPMEIRLNKDVELDGKVVIIVDDVANSGKTLLYSMKPFLQHHPKKIQTLVLVARSHKTFPVHADYVGLCVATTLEEHIYVEVEKEEIVGAYLG
jgi:pyrimidine operon attenuation protein / uracil phosphoribosyltransferase